MGFYRVTGEDREGLSEKATLSRDLKELKKQ